MSLADLGGSLPYWEADHLIDAWIDTPGTRIHAQLAEWDFPMSLEAINAQAHLVAYMNAHRDAKTNPTAFSLPWPWTEHERIDPALREELEQKLAARSALGPEHDDV